MRTGRDVLFLLGAVVGDDAHLAAALDVLDADDAGVPREPRGALGRARLEQLDDAGQPVGDVGLGHAAGVEGPHRELGAGLADRLGRDDADGLAELDEPAGRERLAVALGADAVLGLAGERRAHPDAVDRTRRRGSARRARRRASCPASSVPSESSTGSASTRP